MGWGTNPLLLKLTPELPTAKAMSFAQISNTPRDATVQDIVTNALAMEAQNTAHKTVPLHNLKITMPLQHEGWLHLLTKHCLLVKYPNILNYIQQGTDARIPQITGTYTPPNCLTIYEYSTAFEEIVNQEFDKG